MKGSRKKARVSALQRLDERQVNFLPSQNGHFLFLVSKSITDLRTLFGIFSYIKKASLNADCM